MELKPGYKNTEIGVIPEDWDVRSGYEITDLIGKGASPNWQGFAYSSYGMLFVTSENVRDGFLDVKQPKYLPLAFHHKIRRTKLEIFDVLINIVGASIGRSCQVKNDLGEANINQAVALFRVNKSCYPGYIGYYFQSLVAKSLLLSFQVDAARPNVSLTNLRNMPVILPSKIDEQEKIARTLSDIDSLITSIEKLIEKKKLIKQGAMQVLLTGKKRLPGFSREWETKRLGDSLVFERPDKYIYWGKELKPQGAIPVLTANKSFILGYANEYAGVYNDVPAIIFDDFTTDCKYVRFPFKVKSSAIKILKPANHDVDLRFIFYTMQSTKFSIGDHKRYYISEYQHLKISLPKIDEQAAIADVIEDIEIEIDLRVKQLNKQILLKQAMMKELLTGRIRLI